MKLIKLSIFLLMLIIGIQNLAFSGDRDLRYIVCSAKEKSVCPGLWIKEGILNYKIMDMSTCISYTNTVSLEDIKPTRVTRSGSIIIIKPISDNCIKCKIINECYTVGPNAVKDELKNNLSIKATDEEKATELFKILTSI